MFLCAYFKINNLQKSRDKARRMLIYKNNLRFVQVSVCFLSLPPMFFLGAPKIGQISLAKQGAIRVQLRCPDFDNGMKTP